MNRADRRRFKKYGNAQGEVPTPSLNDFVHLYSLSFILSMHSCEIDKDKLVEVMEKVYETSECMLSGHINQTDVETMCRDIYGIDFVENSKNRIFVDGNRFVRT